MCNFLLKAVAAATLLISSCNKEEKTDGVFKAKLVASFCAYNIVEIQDKSFYGLGMNWKASNGTEYKNVFAIANFCDFAKHGLKVNDVFNCRVIERPLAESCAVCMGYMETPPLNRNIELVQ
ncbi:MAG TPA: hypothetical protein VFV46_08315 [Lacibacter sp.]|nr:hypothetical protein [Lacibacter sp.]